MLECVGTTFIYRHSPVRVKTGIAILPCIFESSVYSIVGLQFAMIEKKESVLSDGYKQHRSVSVFCNLVHCIARMPIFL